jgi:ligand-binding sensor domain-containing protein/DNA-binding CsgD family transcriptional regulator
MSKAITIVLLLFTFSVFAREKSLGLPNIRNYYKSEYKAGTQNWAISQDQSGHIYFANNDGLLSFNGVEWNLSRISSIAPLRSLHIDRQNTIYVGLINDFGIVDREGNRPESYQSLKHLIPEAHKDFDDIWNIYEVDGGIVFQCFQYLFFYKDEKIQVIEPQKLFHFCFFTRDRLLVHEPGIGLYEFTNGELKVLPWWNRELDLEICHIHQPSANTLLIGTTYNGVYLLKDGKLNKWNTPVNDILIRNKLFSFTGLPGGLLAFGTILNGVVISDAEGMVLYSINEKSGLGNNTVLSLYVDRSENLWLGLDNGIDYLEINSPLQYIGSRKIGTGYSCRIFQDMLYLGTNQGLYARPLSGKPPAGDFELVKNTAGQVWTLEEFDGQLLCGHALGTFLVDGYKATRISDYEGVWKYMKLRDHPDLLLAGYYEGLMLFRKVNNQWRFHKKIEGFDESSRYLFQGREGYIWVGHSGKGVFRVRLDDRLERVEESKVYSTEQGLPAMAGNILFSFEDGIYVSSNQGIYSYQSQSDSFVPATALDEIFGSSGKLKYVAAAENGYHWYIADLESGYIRKNEDLSYTRVTIPLRKLRDKYVNEFEFIYPYTNEYVFVGAEQGFVHYNPLKTKSYDEPFSAMITRVDLNYLDSVLYFYADSNSGLFEFPFGNNSFRFHFASPFFENEGPLLFSFFLEGFSEEWSAWSTNHYKDFNTLREGSYIMGMKAKNIFGAVSETAYFPFKILPPWWRSKLAYVLYLLIVSALASILIWYMIYRIKKSVREKELVFEREMQYQEDRHLQETLRAEKEILDLKNEKLHAEMVFRDKELANQTMVLIEKNRLLKRINDDLHNVQDFMVNKTAKNKIRSLKREISKEIDVKHQNKIFEAYFDEANEKLFKQLKERFPDLTPYDLRLCAFIRMNISTKEIAAILNISYRGAEVSRYRLRKKLKLSRGESLSAFIAGF